MKKATVFLTAVLSLCTPAICSAAEEFPTDVETWASFSDNQKHLYYALEEIEEDVTGMTFKSGDVEDLKDKILKMFAQDFDYQAVAKDAIERYSSEAYYHKLMEYYK